LKRKESATKLVRGGKTVSTNRRDVLKSALLTTAVGIGKAGASGLTTLGGAAQPGPGEHIVLYGVRWQITSQDLKRGELPPAGIRMQVRGELYDKPSGGHKACDFFATYHRLSTPGKAAHHEPGSMEVHTFVFSDGTLIGSGIANSAPDSEGQFAIIGGTGRYHGTRGSYLATQRHIEFGGDGSARFTLTLI
jgi:hypothetical protein